MGKEAYLYGKRDNLQNTYLHLLTKKRGVPRYLQKTEELKERARERSIYRELGAFACMPL